MFSKLAGQNNGASGSGGFRKFGGGRRQKQKAGFIGNKNQKGAVRCAGTKPPDLYARGVGEAFLGAEAHSRFARQAKYIAADGGPAKGLAKCRRAHLELLQTLAGRLPKAAPGQVKSSRELIHTVPRPGGYVYDHPYGDAPFMRAPQPYLESESEEEPEPKGKPKKSNPDEPIAELTKQQVKMMSAMAQEVAKPNHGARPPPSMNVEGVDGDYRTSARYGYSPAKVTGPGRMKAPPYSGNAGQAEATTFSIVPSRRSPRCDLVKCLRCRLAKPESPILALVLAKRRGRNPFQSPTTVSKFRCIDYRPLPNGVARILNPRPGFVETP